MLSTVRHQKKYRDYQNVKETILMCNTIQGLGTLVAVFTLVVAVVLGLPTPAQAGYLVVRSTVVQVENRSSNRDNFAILVKGGVGPCIDKVIIFPKSGVANTDVYRRG